MPWCSAVGSTARTSGWRVGTSAGNSSGSRGHPWSAAAWQRGIAGAGSGGR